jgi:hypothetical protein
MAGSSSSGSLRVLLNSASSTLVTAASNASLASASEASPAFQNSNKTAKSSTPVSTAW